MPAVRDVGARFIAPACRHCALGDVRKLLPRAVAAGPFSFIHRGRGEKCRLVRPTAAVASCLLARQNPQCHPPPASRRFDPLVLPQTRQRTQHQQRPGSSCLAGSRPHRIGWSATWPPTTPTSSAKPPTSSVSTSIRRAMPPCFAWMRRRHSSARPSDRVLPTRRAARFRVQERHSLPLRRLTCGRAGQVPDARSLWAGIR